MRHKLMILGDDIRINTALKEYVFARYEEKFGEISEIVFVSKKSNELLFAVQNHIQDIDALSIVASSENYDIMAKILATLSDDVLELKDENTLAAKNAINFKNGSFLIRLNQTYINLIRTNSCNEMSEILIDFSGDIRYFNLYDVDLNSAKILLEPLLDPYKVQIELSEILPNLVLVRCESEKFGSIGGFLLAVKNLFSNKFIDDGDIVRYMANKLIQKGLKITFAESCTAGMCAASFARFAGVSAAFDGSLVTYANRIKSEWLGVSNEILQTYGAVSSECMQSMLNGALASSDADFALAISGVAGPGGGSEEKPVGMVYVGAMDKSGNLDIKKLHLKGDRNYIRSQSVLHAYCVLLGLRDDLFFD
ncbi:Putative competence-damage inducible protein [Campylobacter majalis]|uniref:Competence-damage inducible protein n=1 Tax=Campylobacter majalis TaxID=2790656 RepID=A0ABM8Q3U4_9BACT|nr:CinA family protein [Campylobacter majalis]CAD7287549.1 Putative competence-damage inducible protein [Campylobacter majalis]